MLEPGGDQGVVQDARLPALLVHHGHAHLDQPAVALVQHHQDVATLGAEGASRLGGVVEAEHGGRGSPAQDPPARVQAGAEVAEPVGGAGLEQGHGVDAQAGPGHHAQGALRPDEQLGQVGTGRGPGAGPARGHQPAVGQRHLQAHHHVLDLPVAGGVLPGGAARQPAAHGGQGKGLGPVAQGDAVPGPQLGLQVITEGAGGHVGHQ